MRSMLCLVSKIIYRKWKKKLHQMNNKTIESLFLTLYQLHLFTCKKETAMGVSVNALSKPNSEYVKAVNT